MTMTDTQRAAEDVRQAISAAEKARGFQIVQKLDDRDKQFVLGYAAGVLAARETKTA